MLSKVMQKMLAVLLTVACPSAIVMADRPSAILQTSGRVTLNGILTPHSVSVFTGDLIDTTDASVASVSRSGSSVVVDPNSSIRYQDDGFAILRGRARVQTANGMTVHAGPISVIPATKSALFDVSSDGRTALITSREGPLTLTDGFDSTTLGPGYTAKVSLDISQDQGQAPKPAAKGGEKKRKIPPAWLLWVAAAAGAFAVACALTCGTGAAAISPVFP
jgi:hypothetical protein